MKNKITLSIIFFLILSCSNRQDYRKKELDSLKISLVELIKTNKLEQVFLSDIEKVKKTLIIEELTKPLHSVEQIDKALNEGYFMLLEDIAKRKYPCIDEVMIENKYKFTDWESRTIGFPNWVTTLKGSLLLTDANNLQYQILIMKLLEEDELAPLIEQKEVLLKEALDELMEYTNEEKWVD